MNRLVRRYSWMRYIGSLHGNRGDEIYTSGLIT